MNAVGVSGRITGKSEVMPKTDSQRRGPEVRLWEVCRDRIWEMRLREVVVGDRDA